MEISVIYLLEDTNKKVSGEKLVIQEFGNLVNKKIYWGYIYIEVVCFGQTQDIFSRIHFSHFNNFKQVHTQTPHIFLCTPKHPHNTLSY